MYQELFTDPRKKVRLSIIADECSDSTEQSLANILWTEVLRPKTDGHIKVKKVTRSLLDDHLKGLQLSVNHLQRGLSATMISDGAKKDVNKDVNKDEATLLSSLWSALYSLETECDVVIFGPIDDPILKLLKNMILAAVPTVETVLCKEYTMAILKKRRMRDFINPKFPILTDDEIKAIKRYNIGVAPFPDGKLLTPYMKTVKINQLRRLRMAMIDSPTGCTSDEIVRFRKYCTVILDGIRYNLDWTKAEYELGIDELKEKYMTKVHKKYKVLTIK